MSGTTNGLRLGPYGYAPAPKTYAIMNQKSQIKVGQKISAKRLTEHDAQTYLQLDNQRSRNIIVRNISSMIFDLLLIVSLETQVGVPAAFAPNCDAHPPGYIENYEEFKMRGVSDIFIVAVNDAFVMSAWKRHLAPQGTGQCRLSLFLAIC